MTNKTRRLVLEEVCAIRADLAGMKVGVQKIWTLLGKLELHYASMSHSVDRIDIDVNSIKKCLAVV